MAGHVVEAVLHGLAVGGHLLHLLLGLGDLALGLGDLGFGALLRLGLGVETGLQGLHLGAEGLDLVLQGAGLGSLGRRRAPRVLVGRGLRGGAEGHGEHRANGGPAHQGASAGHHQSPE